MAQLLYRLGRFTARRRRSVLFAWLIALIAFGGVALGFHGTLTDSFTIPGTPAQQAMDELSEEIPGAGGATGTIVFAAPAGAEITAPQYQQAMGQMLAQTAELDGVAAVIDPETAGTVARDASMAYAQVLFTDQMTEIPVATQQRIAELADTHAVDGMTIVQGGAAVEQMPAIGSTEALGVAIALVVLLIMFGSVVAAGLPMLTALIGVGVGMAGILITARFIEMSNTAPILALMLGLAVGIDYALFIVHRHRRQLTEGMAVEESIGRAVGTAGSAVVFAGLTVIIALAALSVVGIPFLAVMGIAAAATVAIAVLIAITLVPALLGFAGEKILSRRSRAAIAPEAAPAAEPAAEPARPNRWSRLVTRRPVTMLIAGVLALGVLAIPAFSLHMGLPDDGSAAPDTPQRQAYDLISESFGPGANGPLAVTVRPDDPNGLSMALSGTIVALSQLDDVAMVMPAGTNEAKTFGMLQLIPASGPADEATQDLVHAIRDRAPALHDELGAEVAVTGLTAMEIDVSEKLADALPVYLIVVVGLALLLLMLVFRSILVPIKAAVGFLLTIAASFGAVVAVYQWGWLGSVFNVDTPGPIVSFLPILLIGVLFGLAMDYEVFMVSGMREAWVHRHTNGDDATAAVRQGFSAGARVVTAAAIIMASVFGGFIFAPDTIIASIGFALALGVLLDAFVVRMTLVPAVMTLLGRRAWYLPRWLERVLPNVDIEGATLRTDAATEEERTPVTV